MDGSHYTESGHLCAVCNSEGGHVNVRQYSLCNDPRCADIAKSWLSKGGMDPNFSNWESMACDYAGKRGGQMLMELGVTDMAKLSGDQWKLFVKTIIGQYRENLRSLAEEKSPPF